MNYPAGHTLVVHARNGHATAGKRA
jgi:hypothetical protein